MVLNKKKLLLLSLLQMTLVTSVSYGKTANGIAAEQAGVSISITGEETISASGETDTNGVLASSGGKVTITGPSVTVKSDSLLGSTRSTAMGLNANGTNSEITILGVVDIAVNAGKNARGIYVQNGGVIRVGDMSDRTDKTKITVISHEGQVAHGITASSAGSSVTTGAVVINSTAKGTNGNTDYSYGVSASGGAQVSVGIENNLKNARTEIHSEANQGTARGVSMTGKDSSGTVSQITIGVANITAKSNREAIGVGGDTGQITIGQAGQGTLIQATSQDTHAAGIKVTSSGKVNILGKVEIDVTGKTAARGLWAQGANSQITIHGGTITAKYAGSAGEAIRTESGSLVVGDRGAYRIDGNLRNLGGTIQIDFAGGSSLQGTSELSALGTTNLSMSGTIWKMTGDSGVTKLDFLDSRSDVYFTGPNKFNTLTVARLTGSTGQFHMRTDVVGGQGDKLVVMESLSGSHQVTVENIGSAATTGKETLVIIEDYGENGMQHFQLTQQVELGGYEYGLRENAESKRYLELAATGSSTSGDGGVNLFAGSYMLHYAELQTLMKRMGDLRDDERQSNVWGHIFGGKSTSAGDGFLRDFDLSYTGVQVGADKKRVRKDGRGTSYLGGFFGYTNGTPSFSRGGDGKIESYQVGGYWTYKHHNEFYADVVLKYGWMDSNLDLRDSAGKKVKGDLRTNVFSLSGEVGRRYHLDQQAQQGFYIEPQIQLSVTHFDGDNITASNGLRTQVDSFTSKLVRLGTHVGYDIREGKNPINIYLKGYFVKEFDGNIGYRFNNGTTHTTSYEDTWFVYGLGATAKLGERHNLYLDFERAEGGRMEQDWSLSGGYRYSW